MEFVATPIAGVVAIKSPGIGDARGRFRRSFCMREFAAHGLMTEVVQMNHSVTLGLGTVRGMHFQHPPAAEQKLVTCIAGRVFDVAVDLRRGSPTFLRWHGVELREGDALHLPRGCAHGFQVLSEEAQLVYLHSEYYAPEHEAGIRWDDPSIAIAWPLSGANLSGRDRSLPLVSDDFEGIDP